MLTINNIQIINDFLEKYQNPEFKLTGYALSSLSEEQKLDLLNNTFTFHNNIFLAKSPFYNNNEAFSFKIISCSLNKDNQICVNGHEIELDNEETLTLNNNLSVELSHLFLI